MTKLTFQGESVNVSGKFPKVRETAPNFTLCGSDLSDFTLDSLEGKNIILNIFPSIDTPVCANSVRVFNERAAEVDNAVVVCISADLPFAMARFCAENGVESVKMASFFRHQEFTEMYGVNLYEGALRNLAARAVLSINPRGEVVYSQLVSEITNEPDYKSALTALDV